MFASTYLIASYLLMPGEASHLTVSSYICGVFLYAIAKPGVFVVAHVAYFGPIIIVWFSTIGLLGAVEVIRFPAIVGAPTHATVSN